MTQWYYINGGQSAFRLEIRLERLESEQIFYVEALMNSGGATVGGGFIFSKG